MLLSTVLCLAVCPVAASLDGLEVGDTARYRFRTPPLEARGMTRLEDLRGKPVLIFFWGHESWGASEYMKDVLLWQRRWGEDLAVIFVESQGASITKAEATALRWKWLGTRAMYTTEHPVKLGLTGTPMFALLSNKGTLLQKGVAEMWGMALDGRVMDEIEAGIESEVELRRKGPADVPPKVSLAFEQFARGQVTQAFATLEEEAGTEAATRAREDFEQRLDQRLKEARWLLDQGRLLTFEELLERLEQELQGRTDAWSQYEALAAEKNATGYAREREAHKGLAKVELRIYKKGPKKPTLRSLQNLAKKHAGTKCATRAERLIELAAIK